MNQVYSKDEFKMYRADDGYIVHNSNKDFQDGHTHLKSFEQGKFVIDMVRWKRIPHHLSLYLLKSLFRIAVDEDYKSEVMELIATKESKSRNVYRNRRYIK
jgi:hypothetical protein